MEKGYCFITQSSSVYRQNKKSSKRIDISQVPCLFIRFLFRMSLRIPVALCALLASVMAAQALSLYRKRSAKPQYDGRPPEGR